jgi:hypothetical protein
MARFPAVQVDYLNVGNVESEREQKSEKHGGPH